MNDIPPQPQSGEPTQPSGTTENVPAAVIGRLSLYLRELQQLERLGKKTISSRRLAQQLGSNDAQIRKDFAYFGQFGIPGVGYRCSDLISRIKQILGTDRDWRVALVGCGNLGQALLGYQGFSPKGINVVAAFDIDPKMIGKQITHLIIHDFRDIGQIVAEQKIELAILSVPAGMANSAAERLVEVGINGILNFAPVTLNVPKQIHVVEVDLAIEMEQLVFRVARKRAIG